MLQHLSRSTIHEWPPASSGAGSAPDDDIEMGYVGLRRAASMPTPLRGAFRVEVATSPRGTPPPFLLCQRARRAGRQELLSDASVTVSGQSENHPADALPVGAIRDHVLRTAVAMWNAGEAWQQCAQCPITHDLFADPVIASDGYTYERDALVRWLRCRNSSPMTNEPLATHDDGETVTVNLMAHEAIRQMAAWVGASPQWREAEQLPPRTGVAVAVPRRPGTAAAGRPVPTPEGVAARVHRTELARVHGSFYMGTLGAAVWAMMLATLLTDGARDISIGGVFCAPLIGAGVALLTRRGVNHERATRGVAPL